MQGDGRKAAAVPVDWSRVRDPLANWAAGAEADAAQQAEVFAARAHALARPVSRVSAPEGPPWLHFRLGRERYALAVEWVVSIGRVGDLASVPGAPAYLLGVANVRGQLLPVFDLRQLFGVQSRGIVDMGRLLLLGRQGRADFGVLADEVEGQRPANHADAEASVSPQDPCLAGIAADGTLIIDGQALLADARLVMEDHA